MSKHFSELESRLGDSVPAEYLNFLRESTFNSDLDYAIEAAGFYWMIDEFYTANSADRRLEEIYDSVSHAIPDATFPIISTLGGFILLYGASKNDDNAYYWDHERDAGDDTLVTVASSSRSLLAAIKPYVDDG